jgi:hypothetical protein
VKGGFFVFSTREDASPVPENRLQPDRFLVSSHGLLERPKAPEGMTPVGTGVNTARHRTPTGLRPVSQLQTTNAAFSSAVLDGAGLVSAEPDGGGSASALAAGAGARQHDQPSPPRWTGPG